MVALHVPRTAPDEGVINAAKKALGPTLIATKEAVGEITLTVERDEITNVLRTLRDTPGLEYQQLMEIAGVDLQPCGGTHIRNTAEIGPVIVAKIENKGRQNRRVILAFAE